MKKPVIALFCYNAEPLQYYRVTVASVLRFHPDAQFRLLKLGNIDSSAFEAWCRDVGAELLVTMMHAPMLPMGNYAPPVFWKLLVFCAWPELDAPVVYLDPDCFVRGRLDMLLCQVRAMTSPVVLAVPNLEFNPTPNGGMLAFNPACCHVSKEELARKLCELTLPGNPRKCEQHFVAELFAVSWVGHEWNYNQDLVTRLDWALETRDPAIVHFLAGKKPWMMMCNLGMERYLDEYCEVRDTVWKEPIVLAYSVNSPKWAEYALTSAWEAARHTRRKIIVRLLTTSFEDVRAWMLENQALVDMFGVTLHKIPEAWLASGNSLTYTSAVFGKNFAPYLLEDRRFIMIDTDCMVRADIAPIFDMVLPEKHLFAVHSMEGWPFEPEYRKKNGLKNVNGGFMVYDREKIVREFPVQHVLDTNRRIADFTRFPDEDLLLFSFGNRFTILPSHWNYIFGKYGNVAMVHFIQRLKPWYHEDVVPQARQFSAYYAEWRAANHAVRKGQMATFAGHAARPPMAEVRTPGHRLKMEMFDGERCLPAGAEVPESDFDATLLDRGILTLMEAEPIAPGR